MNAVVPVNLLTADGSHNLPATAAEVLHHVAVIDEIKRKVMKDGMHYGTIPGCGDKPALLKPGAEKICLTFKLAPEFDVEVEPLPNGHKQYTVTCRLRYRDGTLVGMGIGVCSTMESKYRFRSDHTGRSVPQEYWNARDTDLLGGPEFSAKKIKGKWVIVRKVEHDNPADYYNTCAKIAKKRAHVDATITSTAASDIFDQDTEEREPGSDDEGGGDEGAQQREAPRAQTGNAKSTPAQHKIITAKLEQAKLKEADLLAHFKVATLADLHFDAVNDVLAWVGNGG